MLISKREINIRIRGIRNDYMIGIKIVITQSHIHNQVIKFYFILNVQRKFLRFSGVLTDVGCGNIGNDRGKRDYLFCTLLIGLGANLISI